MNGPLEFRLLRKELIRQDRAGFIHHASNFCLLNDTPFVVWFSGSKEGSPDTGIFLSVLGPNGFAPARRLTQPGEAHWNPVLHACQSGKLILLYKKGDQIRTWRTMRRESTDAGGHWSAEEELVPGDLGGRGPSRCKLLTLSDGSVAAGGSLESGTWKAFCDRADSDLRIWQRSADITVSVNYHGEDTGKGSEIPVSRQSFFGRGVIQPTMWESAPGQVHMLLRSTEGVLFRSDSHDGGRTWCPARPTALPNNNSGIDVARSEDGTLLICSNPIGENWGARTPLTIQQSTDNGLSWKTVFVLEDGPGEFSYPCIRTSRDNIFVSYTYDRQAIAFVQLCRSR